MLTELGSDLFDALFVGGATSLLKQPLKNL